MTEWMEELAVEASEESRRAFAMRRKDLHRSELVELLYDEVVRLTRIDLARAGRLAEAAIWLADAVGEPASRALAARAMGHFLYLSRCYAPALVHYEAALEIYERLGRSVDVGRTINGTLQTLIYLGNWERALSLAERARQIFAEHHDRLRLARLECNVANIYYRQDQFDRALELYRHAADEMREIGTSEDVAAPLMNMVVCLISVGRFDEALSVHNQTRQFLEKNNLPLLTVEADYNIAYLYFQRGEYTRAIDLYENTRALSTRVGDPYHQALCDLDQAEIYLELNLVEEGSELARRAYDAFRILEMGYEAAKALAFLAMAVSKQRRPEQALRWFDQSRELFVEQGNAFWPQLIDLYKAILFHDLGDDGRARALAERALPFFEGKGQIGKAALCGLLLARIALREGAVTLARARCAESLRAVEMADLPALTFQALLVMGQISERRADTAEALLFFSEAHEYLEDLRGQLRREELKIAFIGNKLSVYESLVWLSLESGDVPSDRIFDYIEKSKSRSLADLISFRASSLVSRIDPDDGPKGVPELRQRLSLLYRQIEREVLRPDADSAQRTARLRLEVEDLEHALAEAVAEARGRDREYASLQEGTSVDPDAIRAAIPEGALLIEYYESRGNLLALIVSGASLEIVVLGAVDSIMDDFRLLQFQLSKFRFGTEYTSYFRDVLYSTSLAHLQALYRKLIGPIRDLLTATHLVIVPHGFLHYVPFHALWDGERFLIDDFAVSYAPSASVYQLCVSKPASTAGGGLVIGVPDDRAPSIDQEARRVAAAIPGSTLSIGTEGQDDVLRREGPASRFIHIAAHGLFREDNPLFSSVVLGDSRLSLFDLYDLDLSSELVTLSGCGTGLNVVVGGDELIGLVRGLLYAGAKAVLVSLWDVHDESTATLMETFYQSMLVATDKAQALRLAMLKVRESHPHPYYWAPFALTGRFQNG
jgi:CHAT domain-containing protein